MQRFVVPRGRDVNQQGKIVLKRKFADDIFHKRKWTLNPNQQGNQALKGEFALDIFPRMEMDSDQFETCNSTRSLSRPVYFVLFFLHVFVARKHKRK